MKQNKLIPMEVVRDEYGCWIHPQYLDMLDALYFEMHDGITHDRYRKGLLDLSIKDTEVLWLCNDDSVSLEKYEGMCETCDLTSWNPKAPDGYVLIDIGWGEDDAFARFAMLES